MHKAVLGKLIVALLVEMNDEIVWEGIGNKVGKETKLKSRIFYVIFNEPHAVTEILICHCVNF